MNSPLTGSQNGWPLGRHLRRTLLSGMAVLLPLIITLWLLTALFRLVNGTITPWVRKVVLITGLEFFSHPAFLLYITPVIGLLVTVMLIYAAGLLSTNLLGVKLLGAFDRLMLRIPVIRAVYGGSKQLMDALSPRGNRSFTEVVLVEYPRKGAYTIGFVTREDLPQRFVPDLEVGPVATIFLPTTPNPTSGWMLIVPRRELVTLPLTVEEGVKLVVSGGIVIPDPGGASPNTSQTPPSTAPS